MTSRAGRFLLAVSLALPGPFAWAAAPAGTQPAGKVTRIGDVRLDLAKRTASFDSEVCLREGALEFLVVGWQTKTHESILHTRARAAHLHAALLVLGLTPGKPARWSGEDEAARFLPPAGAAVTIQLTWKDKSGQRHEAMAGSWLKGPDGRTLNPPRGWIFVGSEVLPDGRYWADVDGEMISVTNFGSSVIDVPFRSSNVNEQRELYANTAVLPPVGTVVEVAIAPVAGAEKAPHARVMLEIDEVGRMRLDGQPMALEDLENWAAKYLQQHEQGMVVIRAAGRALVHDVEAARQALRIGGVREFEVQRVPVEGELLPRTAEQAKGALARWNGKFANYRELIHDPGEEAQRTLDQIALRLEEMKVREAFLKEYAASLRQAMERYKASTQPAGGAPASGGGRP